ncbi:hypothetical protein DFH09DRAFT_1202354 [Mycena vulgaris]|nr:hypothetical protein DFH09DRAFT_1202354 [Mycena vulgaris]
MSERMSTTESSLTELDEDDVEMESLPAVSAQRAYDYILPLMDAFNAAIAPIPLSAERKDDWRESTQALRLKALQKPHKAAIVGKSTLLNALLQHPVLSASASGACTAVPIEVSYKATEGTDATIEFISAEHWETHLGRLLEDAMDKTVDVEEGPADDSGPSLAYQAREKIIGVHALLTDGIVTQYLNKTVSLSTSDSDSMSFEKKLEQYLASDPLTGSGCRKLWPLVKIVKIVGKFEVDLPGHGDADNARDSVANEYLKSADSVFLVAGITRAKDDRDIHAYLHRHLRQIIVDGRIQNKTISLILTGADVSSAATECTLEGAEQETVDTLKEETLRLTDEIKDLVARKEKKEKSKAKKKNTVILQYQEQQYIPSADYIPFSSRFSSMGVVGSRDYLCIKDIELNDPTTFFDPEETGIPGLKRYLENDGERRSLTDAISVVTGFYEFLSRASQIPMKTAGNGTESLWIHNALADLEKGCETKLDELVTQMETAYGELQAHVIRAVGQVCPKFKAYLALLKSG